jgi:hexosaminidase
MKKYILVFLITLAVLPVTAQQNTVYAKVHIVPEPVSVQVNEGYFHLNNHTRIIATAKQTADIAAMLKRMLDAPTGFHLAVRQENAGTEDNAIIFKLNTRQSAQLGDAGYDLKVFPDHVLIEANEARGLFYAVQTLMQLLPPDIERNTAGTSVKWTIPCVNILDYPRFKWRGLMLDVSRHFFSKAFVEQYIDEMARYKFNVFHWHLTDDQGWRIEIKGLPRLTEVGAWRVPRTGRWGTFEGPQPGEEATDGGFYTQEDIREIVAYARKRFVTIVPEVDVPAHSLALIASYPGLSCTKEQYSLSPQYQPGNVDNVLCVANDSTWLILDKIFTQIAGLFPGEYIHVGGDEANRSFWTKDPKDIALMKKEGISTPAGLQSYFEKKLEKLIVSKGKRMIGWDEILEGGLAPEAAVMSWRGTEGGIKAAGMGHQVVMTPTSYCYLDYCQGDPLIEPAAGGRLKLSTCYAFEPVPEGVDPKYILGGQGNLWAENVPNGRHAEYMTWPRSLALAEVLWSPRDKRNWPDFVQRVTWQFKYMDAAQVKYACSAFDPVITGIKDTAGNLKVKLDTEAPGLDIYYTFDGTDPDNFYPKYDGKPLDIPKGATEIRVITYRDGEPAGRQINCPLTVVAQRISK